MWMLMEQDKSQHWLQVRFENCTAAVPGSFHAHGGVWECPRKGSSGTGDRNVSPSAVTAGEARQEGTKGTAQTMPEPSPAPLDAALLLPALTECPETGIHSQALGHSSSGSSLRATESCGEEQPFLREPTVLAMPASWGWNRAGISQSQEPAPSP